MPSNLRQKMTNDMQIVYEKPVRDKRQLTLHRRQWVIIWSP